MIRAVRARYFDQPRRGKSALPLGEAVYRNLRDRGVNDPDEALDGKWQAWQVRDSVWLVTFRHPWRGRDHEAGWELDQTTGTVRPLTRLAADLAFLADDSDVSAPTARRVAAARPEPEPPIEIQLSLPVDPAADAIGDGAVGDGAAARRLRAEATRTRRRARRRRASRRRRRSSTPVATCTSAGKRDSTGGCSSRIATLTGRPTPAASSPVRDRSWSVRAPMPRGTQPHRRRGTTRSGGGLCPPRPLRRTSAQPVGDRRASARRRLAGARARRRQRTRRPGSRVPCGPRLVREEQQPAAARPRAAGSCSVPW